MHGNEKKYKVFIKCHQLEHESVYLVSIFK